MGNLLCGLGDDDTRATSSHAYMRLCALYEDLAESNRILARSNRELKRKLLIEAQRNDQLCVLVSNLYDERK